MLSYFCGLYKSEVSTEILPPPIQPAKIIASFYLVTKVILTIKYKINLIKYAYL